MMSTVGEVKAFYEILRYPGPNALISYLWATRLKKHIPTEKRFTFLDAGCGAGRHTAGMLLTYPDATGYCLDISESSIKLAKELLAAKRVLDRAFFLRASYLSRIPIREKVDVALAIGTIHHCPDPMTALANIANAVKSGGLVCLMVYGLRGNRRRYEIKEALRILEVENFVEVEEYYKSWASRYNTFFHRPLSHLYRETKDRISKRLRVFVGSKTYGYFEPNLDGIFLQDAMLNPIDVAFETEGLRHLIEGSGLEVVEIIGLGRFDRTMIPRVWRQRWQNLEFWKKVRISEIVDPNPKSWSLVLRKP